MALSKRDKQGVAILVALFVILGIALIFMLEPLGPGRDLSESVIIQQRMINLEKNR